jgi:broad specificity phosphatase PhoE
VRTLVHRRHSFRLPGADGLSPAGVARAREVGATSGPFERVVTSPKPRAVDTATAMGYRVDGRSVALAEIPDTVSRWLELQPDSSFGALLELTARHSEVRDFAQDQARSWLEELGSVAEGGRVLMVSHAGIIELGAVGALGPAVRGWGGGLAPLEGVELVAEAGEWTRGRVLRVGAGP